MIVFYYFYIIFHIIIMVLFQEGWVNGRGGGSKQELTSISRGNENSGGKSAIEPKSSRVSTSMWTVCRTLKYRTYNAFFSGKI